MNNKLLLLFLLSCLLGFSQETTEVKKRRKDLKVGLVLSGGGAKGLAHIGAIRVLEEAGIRVDYVGGTSAGAMVGALYASGYNANELDSILRSYDYLELIQNTNSRELYSFYQKENSERYALSLPIKNRSIGLPLALSYGQNMLNEMSKLTKHVHDIKDFKKLPIPFYCVVTDIVNGEEVVLEDGFLPQAIRASGAFPSVFEPVIIDGRHFVDGGITNVFPVDVMEQKDVDIIIGVDVQGELDDIDALDSAIKVVSQIVSFKMYENQQDKRDKTDIYIRPNLEGLDIASFDKIDQLISVGEKAARIEMDYLVAIAAQQIKKPLKIRDKLIQNNNKYLKIKKIHITGNKHYTRNYILSKMKMNRNKKDSISYEEFNKSINTLASTQNFKSIDYTIKPTEDGSIVQFNLIENDISKFVQLGVHYDDLYKTGVLLNFTAKHLLTNNDIVSTDFVLGDNLRYNLNYLLDNGFHWRFGISHRYNSFRRNLFIEPEVNNTQFSFTNSVPVKYNDFSSQLYFQTKFKERFAFNGGLEHKFLNISTVILNNNRNEKFYFDDNDYYGGFAQIVLDTRDSKNFTKKGWYFNAKYNTYVGSSRPQEDFTPFSQLKVNLQYTKTFFEKLTNQFNADSGFTIGSANSSFDYSLGGYNENFINNLVPFYGYDVADLSDTSFLKIANTLQYEVFKKHYLSLTANAAIFENSLDLKSGAAIGYGTNTLVGPIEIKYALTPDNDKHYWYFNIGYWF
ncbi:MAG: patatin-like phospholipase family protein [Flavobacteriaceae bacterium]